MQLDRKWAFAMVVFGAALGISVANLFHDLAGPPPEPQAIYVTIQPNPTGTPVVDATFVDATGFHQREGYTVKLLVHGDH